MIEGEPRFEKSPVAMYISAKLEITYDLSSVEAPKPDEHHLHPSFPRAFFCSSSSFESLITSF